MLILFLWNASLPSSHSTAAALVAYFLSPPESRQILAKNDGNARILVLESNEGVLRLCGNLCVCV
jgi:hypothetical protein